MDKNFDEIKDIMFERNYIILNDLIFKIEPIFLMEETDFLNDIGRVSMMIPDPEEKTEQEIEDKRVQIMFGFFQRTSEEDVYFEKKESFFQLLLRKFFGKEKESPDFEFYRGTTAYPMVKWIEKKVSFNGKNIKFYDLEREYGLNKIEIHKIIERLMEISNFPQLLRLTNKK